MQFVRGSSSANPSSISGANDSDSSSLLLLTAGNDGALCCWDVGRSAETGGSGRGSSVVPQCLARTTDLHTGGL